MALLQLDSLIEKLLETQVVPPPLPNITKPLSL